MSGDLSRRRLLKSSLAVSPIFTAGCTSGDQSTSRSSSTTPAITTQSSVPQQSLKEVPTNPDIPSADRESLLTEYRGTLTLGKDRPYKLFPLRAPKSGADNCFVLEYQALVESFPSQVDIMLIPAETKSTFEKKAQNKKHCVSILGNSHCVNYDEPESLDPKHVDGVSINSVEHGGYYRRVRLPPRDFYLVFDGTDVFSDDHRAEVESAQFTVAVRTLKDRYRETETRAAKAVSTVADSFPSAKHHTQRKIAEKLSTVATKICNLPLAGKIRTRSIADFSGNVGAFRHYSQFFHSVVELIQDEYGVAFPFGNAVMQSAETMRRHLDALATWGSKLLPLIRATIGVCESACQLARSNVTTADITKVREQTRDFVRNLLFFIIEVIMVWMGFTGRVARNAVAVADTFILQYIRQIAGNRIYALVVGHLYLLFQESVVDAIQYIEQKFDVITNSDTTFLRGWDVPELPTIDPSDFNDWRNLHYLFTDRPCDDFAVVDRSQFS